MLKMLKFQYVFSGFLVGIILEKFQTHTTEDIGFPIIILICVVSQIILMEMIHIVKNK